MLAVGHGAYFWGEVRCAHTIDLFSCLGEVRCVHQGPIRVIVMSQGCMAKNRICTLRML